MDTHATSNDFLKMTDTCREFEYVLASEQGLILALPTLYFYVKICFIFHIWECTDILIFYNWVIESYVIFCAHKYRRIICTYV